MWQAVGPVCGLSGFAIAVLSGLLAGSSAAPLLVRAMVSAVACLAVGAASAWVLERVVADAVGRARRASESAGDGGGGERSENSASAA